MKKQTLKYTEQTDGEGWFLGEDEVGRGLRGTPKIK